MTALSFFSYAHIYVPIVFPAGLSDTVFEYFFLKLCFQQKFVRKKCEIPIPHSRSTSLQTILLIVNFRSSTQFGKKQNSKLYTLDFRTYVILDLGHFSNRSRKFLDEIQLLLAIQQCYALRTPMFDHRTLSICIV